ILIYEMFVVAVPMLNHANISLSRFDRPLRWLIVTPRMHQIHHSRLRPETDSNYSTLISFWDRIALTYRMLAGSEPVELGLTEFGYDRWEGVAGMLGTSSVTDGSQERSGAVPRGESSSPDGSDESEMPRI